MPARCLQVVWPITVRYGLYPKFSSRFYAMAPGVVRRGIGRWLCDSMWVIIYTINSVRSSVCVCVCDRMLSPPRPLGRSSLFLPRWYGVYRIKGQVHDLESFQVIFSMKWSTNYTQIHANHIHRIPKYIQWKFHIPKSKVKVPKCHQIFFRLFFCVKWLLNILIEFPLLNKY